MSILSDIDIELFCTKAEQPMLDPFNSEQIRQLEGKKILSRGLSSYGYDATLSRDVKIFTNQNAVVIDPKNLNEKSLIDAEIFSDESGEYFILPPNSYALGSTVEYFRMPRDVLSICMGKSSYARAGVGINVTPIEPGFEGEVVIEISNLTTLPVKVYVNEGIAQFLFYRGDKPCKVSYSDRKGKYQGQRGITLSRV